jgi:hypothetical protein
MRLSGELNEDHPHTETADARANGNGYATNGHASQNIEVIMLAWMPEDKYQRVKHQKAEDLGLELEDLDARVEAQRKLNRYYQQRQDEGPKEEIEDLPLIWAGQLLKTKAPARKWLVDGWIPERQVHLLAGDGGNGKSLFARRASPFRNNPATPR